MAVAASPSLEWRPAVLICSTVLCLMVLVMVCRSWRNCAACPPPRPSTRHRRSPCHHPTVPWWGLALLFSPLLIIWNKIHDSQSLCLGVQYLILWLPHLLLSAVLIVSVSEILGEGPDGAVQVQRVQFDWFYDQTKAKKVISCVKLCSNPRSNFFLEFWDVEISDSMFAIYS